MILRTAVLGWHSCLCPPAGAGHKSHELARRSPVTWAPPSFSSCCNVEKRCQEHGVQPQYHLCTIILIKIDQHVLHGCVCNWCVWINWISLPLKSQFGHSQLVVICCPCLQIAAQPHWSVANLQAKKNMITFALTIAEYIRCRKTLACIFASMHWTWPSAHQQWPQFGPTKIARENRPNLGVWEIL